MRVEQVYPVEGTARLVENRLTIKRHYPRTGKTLETEYLVEELDPHPAVGKPAFRLSKLAEGGEISDEYDLILRAGGWVQCECGDHLERHRDCKHIKAMRKVGLLPPLPQRSQA